jgi:hypothetical protein
MTILERFHIISCTYVITQPIQSLHATPLVHVDIRIVKLNPQTIRDVACLRPCFQTRRIKS